MVFFMLGKSHSWLMWFINNKLTIVYDTDNLYSRVFFFQLNNWRAPSLWIGVNVPFTPQDRLGRHDGGSAPRQIRLGGGTSFCQSSRKNQQIFLSPKLEMLEEA